MKTESVMAHGVNFESPEKTRYLIFLIFPLQLDTLPLGRRVLWIILNLHSKELIIEI